MFKYKEFDAQVPETTFNALARHRKYLQQETVICCLFSDHSTITDVEKHKMARKLLETPLPEVFAQVCPF